MLLAAQTIGAAAITLSNGISPAGGYLPLDLFGITPISGVGDDTQSTFTVPSFTWGGMTFSTLDVSSNGYVTMGDTATSPSNQSLPDYVAPNGILAPYWTDLDPTLGGAIRIGTLTDGTHTWIVVDWKDVALKNQPTATNSFELWIGINGTEDINFQYGALSAPPANLTIGAESVQYAVGTNYYYNGAGTLPGSNTDLRLSTSGAPNLVPEPASVAMFGGGVFALAALGLRKRKTNRS